MVLNSANLKTQLWNILPGARAEIGADIFLLKRIPIMGKFEDCTLNGVALQAVCGTVMTRWESDQYILNAVDGFISSQTAWVPHHHLLKILDHPSLLHFSRYPRIRFQCDPSNIVRNQDGVSYQLKARLSLKDSSENGGPGDLVDMRVEMIAKGPERIELQVVATGEPGLPPGRISRAKLGVSGFPFLVYDEVSIRVTAELGLSMSDIQPVMTSTPL